MPVSGNRIQIEKPHNLSLPNARIKSEQAMAELNKQNITHKWISETNAIIGGPKEIAEGTYTISSTTATLDIVMHRMATFASIVEPRISQIMEKALRSDDKPQVAQPTTTSSAQTYYGHYFGEPPKPQQNVDMGGFSYSHYYDGVAPTPRVVVTQTSNKPKPPTQATSQRKKIGIGLIVAGLLATLSDEMPKGK